jgi:sugar fermentation stimulation protein A
MKKIDLLNKKFKGVYQLLFFFPNKSRIKVGQKGSFNFPKGYYVYTGSAKNSLKGRVLRHLRKSKKKFWHIDYLLPYAKIKDIIIHVKKSECYWNNRLFDLKESEVLVNGFGSSDCRCKVHLLYFKKKPELNFQ